jgi:hypothetical protein
MIKVYHNSYLTTEQVINIKKALKTMSISKVAKLFNMPKNNIRNMYLGITYRNVGE